MTLRSAAAAAAHMLAAVREAHTHRHTHAWQQRPELSVGWFPSRARPSVSSSSSSFPRAAAAAHELSAALSWVVCVCPCVGIYDDRLMETCVHI